MITSSWIRDTAHDQHHSLAWPRISSYPGAKPPTSSSSVPLLVPRSPSSNYSILFKHTNSAGPMYNSCSVAVPPPIHPLFFAILIYAGINSGNIDFYRATHPTKHAWIYCRVVPVVRWTPPDHPVHVLCMHAEADMFEHQKQEPDGWDFLFGQINFQN